MMSNNKNNYLSTDEIEEENSLIKASSELEVQSLYQILIKNPYLVNAIDDKKESILSYSLKNDNIDVSNLILTSPIIDLDYEDKNGNTYLHLAVIAQQEQIIKLLIDKGIFINKQNNEGNTALHLAYTINNRSIINILLENGIDKNILNKENKLADEIKIKNKKFNSGSNNKIRPSKINTNSNNINNKDITKKKENKNILEKNSRKKNSTTLNTINIKQKKKENINKNNINENNNNKFITSSKSGLKIKTKTIPNQDNNKNTKSNNINYNYYDVDIDQSSNDIINLDDDFKNKKNYNYSSNKKISEFEKTVKIDWDNTNNITDKYLNYNYKDKKQSFIKDPDLCNFDDDNSSIYEPKNEITTERKMYKSNGNNKIYKDNINTKESIKKNDKGKKNTKNNNKNNFLGNSIGYNPCTSGEYSYKSDQKYSKIQTNNVFGTKVDSSLSQNNDLINQYESNKNTIHNYDDFTEENYSSIKLAKNGKNYFNEKEDLNPLYAFSDNFNKKQKKGNNNIMKNIPKRKTATSNTIRKNILSSKKDKDENNGNKSSNMSSSLVTQSRLKSSHKRNIPLIEFLSQINLLKYLNNLDSNGFDDINLLLEEAKKGDIVKDQELKEAGINIPGDRAKILIRIKEKANIFGFNVPKSVYHTCQNFEDIENDEHIMNLNNWLKNLKVEKYLMNFLNNGYHSIELLLMQMETENPLTTEILRDEIGIDKIGYRSRILNKLKEEGRSLHNKLKTSVLIVNNRGDDKNCDCFIF